MNLKTRQPLTLTFFLLLLLGGAGGLPGQINFKEAREEMVVSQLQRRGINHRPTLEAMRQVPRHLFVPTNYRVLAYEDTPLPIGYEQTISQPYLVAYMTAAIRPEPSYRVLDIGTGSGYQAAVLAEIVAEVYSMEIIPELGEAATRRLHTLGFGNVSVRIGDGYHGWPEAAPFDAIIVAAAVEAVPPALFDQLREGGRMVIPLGPPAGVSVLTLVSKRHGNMRKQPLFPVRFVPFTRQ